MNNSRSAQAIFPVPLFQLELKTLSSRLFRISGLFGAPVLRRAVLLPALLLLLPCTSLGVTDSTCDQWLQAGAKISLIEADRDRLMGLQQQLNTRLQAAEDALRTAPDHSAAIARQQADVDAKRDEVARLQRELASLQAEAATLTPAKLQQDVETARRESESAENAVFELDEQQDNFNHSRKMKELQRGLDANSAELQKHAPGREPQYILDNLDDPCSALHFPGTDVQIERICCSIGHEQGYAGSCLRIPGDLHQLENMLRTETDTLRTLAKQQLTLQGKIDGERQAFFDSHPDQRRRGQLEQKRDQALRNWREAEERRRSGTQRAVQIVEQVTATDTLLKTGQNEQTALETELKRLQAAQTEPQDRVAGIQNQINDVDARIDAVLKELDEVGRRRKSLNDEIQGGLAAELREQIEFGRKLGTAAVQARKEGRSADCARALELSRQELQRAAHMASANRQCLSQADLDRANKSYSISVERFECGGAGTTTLLKVPAVSMGMTQQQAKNLVTAAGFGAPTFFEYLAPSKPEEAGKVISIIPAPGTLTAPDTKIRISIFNNTYTDLDQADADLSAAAAPGGAWDQAAASASVSVQSRSTAPPSAPSAAPTTTRPSQTDQAAAIAREATAGGPQAEPFVTPQDITGFVSILGSAAQSQSGGWGQPSNAPMPIQNIGSNPLPGVIPSSGSRGGTGGSSTSTGGAAQAGGGADCPIYYTGFEGDSFYLINYGGNPPAFEIRRIWNPPRSDADRLMCGTHSGAGKICIEKSFRDLGKPVPPIYGPYSRSQAGNQARQLCR